MANKTHLSEKVKESLLNLSLLPAIKEKLSSDDSALEVFTAELNKRIDEEVSTFTAADETISLLIKGEEPKAQVLNKEAFIACQDEAVAYTGEWNEETAKLAIASYLVKGEKFELSAEALSRVCTAEELYNIPSDNEFASLETPYSVSQRESLPEEIFCGPNRTFPVTNRAEALAAIKLSALQTEESVIGKIEEAAANFGVFLDKNSATAILAPIILEGKGNYLPIKITNKESAQLSLDNLDHLSKAYGFAEEVKKSVKQFIEECISHCETLFDNTTPLFKYEEDFSAPIKLGSDFLFEYFVRHEHNDPSREYLAQIVGLVRKEKMDIESIKAAGEPYSVFGTSVLKTLLKAPVEAVAPADSKMEADPSTAAIEQIDNPLSSDEATPSETKRVEESVKPGDFFVRPSARKGKKSL